VWLRAWLAGAYVSFIDLVAMRLRQVPYGLVVDARITAKKAGIDVGIDAIQAHDLAGGNVVPTVHAIIAAQKAGIELRLATRLRDRPCHQGFGEERGRSGADLR
jgi:uncharacterized protein YqfA (UPF0365 family)